MTSNRFKDKLHKNFTAKHLWMTDLPYNEETHQIKPSQKINDAGKKDGQRNHWANHNSKTWSFAYFWSHGNR